MQCIGFVILTPAVCGTLSRGTKYNGDSPLTAKLCQSQPRGDVHVHRFLVIRVFAPHAQRFTVQYHLPNTHRRR